MMYFAGSLLVVPPQLLRISVPLLRDEQRRIAAERQQAQKIVSVTQMQFDELTEEVHTILDTLGNGYELYRSAGPVERLTMKRSVFERLWITPTGIVGGNVAPGFAHAAQDDLELRLQREARARRSSGEGSHVGPPRGRTYKRSAASEHAPPTDWGGRLGAGVRRRGATLRRSPWRKNEPRRLPTPEFEQRPLGVADRT